MIYGLLGHKINYSLSPIIHKMINTSGIEYKILDLSPEELKDKLPSIVNDFSGFNVTIPHKQQIMNMCDEVDPLAAKIGAVNTVDINKGKWTGYNTDYLGFIETVKLHIPNFLTYHPVIVGYGGVARAVIVALDELGFDACTVYGGAIASERQDFIDEMDSGLALNIMNELPSTPKLWVNCTPVGAAKNPDIPKGYIPYDLQDVLYDLNYAPCPTYLEKEAKKAGLKTVNGLQMLVSQAIEAQKIWVKGKIKLQCDLERIIHSIVDGKNVS